MSGQRRRKSLRKCLLHAGFDLSSKGPEEDRLVHGWLRAELRRQAVPGWSERLPGAVALGRMVYRSFMEGYASAFLEPDGWGARLVRRFLSQRFGFADAHVEEMVLTRIRNRRLVLLGRLRAKYQPSLFTEASFDPARLPGYLRRVAWVESLKASAAELPWNRAPQTVIETAAYHGGAEEEASEVDYRDLADRVSAFWSKANGFRPEHHLEGVISLGLGKLTGDATLQDRCERLLAEKLPAWEKRLVQMRRRSSRLLEYWENLHTQLAAVPGQTAALQDRMAEIEARIQRCREMLARHLVRLRPKPGEVGRLLDGFVGRPVGSIRHARIGREIALFCLRVREGWTALLSRAAAPLPPAVLDLGEAVVAHLGGEPPSVRQHGLAEAEKRRRSRLARLWLAAAADLLAQIRTRLADLWSTPVRPTPGTEALEAWLCDAEDLYELGVLARKGVIRGLGRRHGWRLHHLLRVAEEIPGSRAARAAPLGCPE